MREFFENVLIYTGGIIACLFWILLILAGLVELITTIIDKEDEDV